MSCDPSNPKEYKSSRQDDGYNTTTYLNVQEIGGVDGYTTNYAQGGYDGFGNRDSDGYTTNYAKLDYDNYSNRE